ncbi:hypothetical protein LPJ59_000021 [Coemansia sp. RSA 2399]|nr:hypothetical protein LPJ59_000021 [Coemansia sp. RSA 2399]KAJ1908520.1 hypothetical protein LPJ81_000021 [Coemansia sp. IMI 209127]
MKPSSGSRITEDCLLLILDYLWDDRPVAQFVERRSEYSHDYDQMRMHHALRSRAISPVHVCQTWRRHAIRRYFRYMSIGLADKPSKANSQTPEALPSAARMFVETLLLQIDTDGDNLQLGVAAMRFARLVPCDLPRARRIGLCVRGSMPRHSHRTGEWIASRLEGGDVLENHLAVEIISKLPALESVWFQSTTMAGTVAHGLVRTLNKHASNKVHVSSIHLQSTTTNDGDTAIDIIRECAHDIQNLCLGMVSGGVLSTLIQWRPEGQATRISADTASAIATNAPQIHAAGEDSSSTHKDTAAIYPKLRRLIFGVDTHVHVVPNAMAAMQSDGQPPGATGSPFPALEELYFDHTLSNGLPMEEWYAPLYDVFLKHANKKLKHLTFPIIYNTQRTVSRRNCPELVSLRHIKCCWSTGIWSASQAESDSTRVLKAVATIPTLTCYIHPSYIEGLSALPTEINCTRLKYLDLYGWPLSLDNLLWLLSTFGQMRSLSVTVVPTIRAPPQEDPFVDEQSPIDSHSSAGMEQLSEVLGPLLRHLVVGAGGGGDLGDFELSRLFVLLNSLPSISTISLYSSAYSFVKANLEAWCELCFPDGARFLQEPKVRLTNLDRVGLNYIQMYSARDSQTNARHRGSTVRMLGSIPSMESLVVPWRRRRPSHRTPAARVASAATGGGDNVVANGGGGGSSSGNRNGWQLIRRLLLGE